MIIRDFCAADRDAVIALVLHCQNDGTRPPVTVDDQPDLPDVENVYQKCGGGFWVADDNGKVAGSIGLVDHGGGRGVLKKFFVYEAYRGAPHHLGRQLFGVLKEHAVAHGFKTLYLDTPVNTDRAHRFYEKSGFVKIAKEEVPFAYSYPYADSDFFKLTLD